MCAPIDPDFTRGAHGCADVEALEQTEDHDIGMPAIYHDIETRSIISWSRVYGSGFCWKFFARACGAASLTIISSGSWARSAWQQGGADATTNWD